MELAVFIGWFSFALPVHESLALFVRMLEATMKLKNLSLFVHSVTLCIISQILKDEVQEGVKLKKAKNDQT